MPNLAFQIDVLKQVITERAASGDTLASSLIKNNFNNPEMQFAVLGAMGPDMLRYMPISNALATFLSNLVPSATSGIPMNSNQIQNAIAIAQLTLAELASGTPTPAQLALGDELYFNPLGATYSVLFSTLVVPLWPIFSQITDVFNQLDTIVQNQDTAGLAGMIGKVKNIANLQQSLVGAPATVQIVMQGIIGPIITLGPWMEMTNVPESSPAPTDFTMDRRYEFLRWHHTGGFAKNLWTEANKKRGTANQKAYAFGWLCHIASSVTAEPFVNNIVGGPYRTHWWRNRLVGNFVDSWTYGFFANPGQLPTMNGDNPTPAYCNIQTGEGWPSICNANLQDMFNVANLAGSSTVGGIPDAVTAMANGNISTLLNNFQFPHDISTLLNNTMSATYPITMPQPTAGVDSNGNNIPAFAQDTFAKAYIGAFAVYWFMTSGNGPLGNNPTGVPTGMGEPSWIQQGTVPTAQQALQNINVGGVIWAILLAIVALFEILSGNLLDGLVSLVAAIEAPVINWSQVTNDLFWLRKTLVDQENALRDLLVWSGLTYPPPVLLGMIDPDGNTLPVTDLTPQQAANQNFPTTNVPATQGTPLCKTNSFTFASDSSGDDDPYPHQLDPSVDSAADLDWLTYPILIPTEESATDNLIPAYKYPNSLILNNAQVQNGGIMATAPFPTGGKILGDAVANALQLINAANQAEGLQGLLDYNLDGDRGYGWQTWNPQSGSNPSNGNVQVVQEQVNT